MNQATQVSLAFAFAHAISQGDLSGLWFSLFFHPRGFWPLGHPTSGLAILCFSMV
jgi:hypothetical protein